MALWLFERDLKKWGNLKMKIFDYSEIRRLKMKVFKGIL